MGNILLFGREVQAAVEQLKPIAADLGAEEAARVPGISKATERAAGD